MNWTKVNGKYCMGDWRVYKTASGWRVSHRAHKELPHFEEVQGAEFDTYRQAITAVEVLHAKEVRK